MAESSQQVPAEVDSLICDGKNKTKVVCQLCPSIILLAGKASYVSKDFPLPLIMQKKESSEKEVEDLCDYWVVDDMFTFENVAFSKTVGTIKYLICADCEIGPIGWHDLNDKSAYYISLQRVKHEQS